MTTPMREEHSFQLVHEFGFRRENDLRANMYYCNKSCLTNCDKMLHFENGGTNTKRGVRPPDKNGYSKIIFLIFQPFIGYRYSK